MPRWTLSPSDRFLSKVRKTETCWLWTGTTDPLGYGRFFVLGRGKVLAHRYAYEQARGPVPAGLVLDHLCRVPRCVRADHLEAVRQRVNVLRGLSDPASNAKKSKCLRGHPLAGSNLLPIHHRDGRIERRCRECANARKRKPGLPRVRPLAGTS